MGMPPQPAVSGRRTFWVQLAGTLLLGFGTSGAVWGLLAANMRYVGLFAVVMALGLAVQSYVYFLRARAGPDAMHR